MASDSMKVPCITCDTVLPASYSCGLEHENQDPCHCIHETKEGKQSSQEIENTSHDKETET